MEIMGKWRRLWFLWSLSAIIRTPYSSFLFQSQKSKLSSLHFIYLLKDNLQVYLHSLLSIISLLIPVLESSNNNRAIFPRKIPDFFFEFTDLFSSFERSTIFSSREVRTSATVFVSLTDSST
ncbi:Protein of unknown function, partial [Gryllus bimaculatus]